MHDGVTIPVGKDSLSMKMSWSEENKEINVKSPNTLIVSAFASVDNLKNIVKPMFINKKDTSIKILQLFSLAIADSFFKAGIVSEIIFFDILILIINFFIYI